MKKSITYSLFATLICLALFIGKTNAQTTIYYQNFDSSYILPTGWNSVATGPSPGFEWAIDSTNSSYAPNGIDGYNSASGLNNVVVENIWNTSSSGTEIFVLTTNNIATTNYKNIMVEWGCRNTKHFEDNLSAVSFWMSTDNGSTWDSIPYFENAPNSLWFEDNNGSPIALTSSADHQANLKFKWIAYINLTASGTYRIDDFTVSGTSSPTGIVETQDKPSAYVYVVNNSSINVVSKDLTSDQKLTVELFDMLGNSLRKEVMTTSTLAMKASDLSGGMYLVRVSNDVASEVTKVVLSR